MKDTLTFALVLLAAICAECIPALLALTGLAAVVALGGKIPDDWDFGQKKTAPRAGTSESGVAERKAHAVDYPPLF